MKFVFGMLFLLTSSLWAAHRFFKNLCLCEVRFWDGFGLYLLRFGLLEQLLTNVPQILASGADLGECIEDLGLCREFNSNASDENAKGAKFGECI